ncbi:MAG: hypothetical protein R3B93_27030 [Bacteroidia bacterium]
MKTSNQQWKRLWLIPLAEMDKIAGNLEPPTFENTIVARESADELMDRLYTYYGIWSSNVSSPNFGKYNRNWLQIVRIPIQNLSK